MSRTLGFKKLFTDRVFPEPNTGCWIWAGPIGADGYGNVPIVIHGIKMCRAHRISYAAHYGEFDYNLLVCHRCDNPLCVNPEHLFLGTAKDNAQDMVKKGRRPSGGRNMKLTPDQVYQIKTRLDNGERGSKLAKEFKVTHQNICRIKYGKSWVK